MSMRDPKQDWQGTGVALRLCVGVCVGGTDFVVELLRKMQPVPLTTMRDVQEMRELWSAIQALSRKAVINVHQCRLVSLRLGVVCRTVLMLPTPRPSPRLLTVLQSAKHLLSLMADERHAVESFLPRRHTASELFAALFQKLRRVWSLQSTLQWETENNMAAEKDAAAGMDTLAGLLEHAANSGGVGSAPAVRGLLEVVKRARRRRHHQQQQQQQQEQQQEQVHRSSSTCAPPPSGPVTFTLTEEDRADLLTFFHRRCRMSGWKLQFEELEPCSTCSIPRVLLPPSAPLLSGGATIALAPRWEIVDGFMFGGEPVVVKELSHRQLLTPAMMQAFVVDMVSRYSWCHPNIINFEGAYCEKFDRISWMEPEGLRIFCPDTDNAAESAGRIGSGMPHAALGLVMSKAPQGHLPLHYVLFVEKRRLSASESLEIALQITDALQYVLYDAPNVASPAVVEAWMTISASNVFVKWRRGDSDSDGRIAVLLSPHVAIPGGPVNRWRPHADAVCKEAFAVTILLASMLSAAPPYAAVSDQHALAAIFSEADDAPAPFNVEAIVAAATASLPATAAHELGSILERGMALRGGAAISPAHCFTTLQDLRNVLLQALEVVGAEPPSRGGDELLGSVDEIDLLLLDDYGTFRTTAAASAPFHEGGALHPAGCVSSLDLLP